MPACRGSRLTKFETPCWLSTPTTTPVISTSCPLRGVVLPEPWTASMATGVGGPAHGAPHAVPLAAPDGPAKSALLSSVSCRPAAAALRVKVKSAPVVGKVRPGPLGAGGARRADRVLRDGARVLDQEAAGLGDLEVVGRVGGARVVARVLAEDEGLPGGQLGAGAQRIAVGPHARRPARGEAVEELPTREVDRRRGGVLDLDVLVELRGSRAQAQLGDDDARRRRGRRRGGGDQGCQHNDDQRDQMT